MTLSTQEHHPAPDTGQETHPMGKCLLELLKEEVEGEGGRVLLYTVDEEAGQVAVHQLLGARGC